MDTWLTQLLSSANGRHFRDDELHRILLYVESMPDRLETAKSIAGQRDTLIRSLTKANPDLANNTAFIADIVDLLQCVTQAMLLDDVIVLENKLADRLYSLMVLMGLSQSTLDFLLVTLEDQIYSRLSAKSKGHIAPYLSWVKSHAASFNEVAVCSA